LQFGLMLEGLTDFGFQFATFLFRVGQIALIIRDADTGGEDLVYPPVW